MKTWLLMIILITLMICACNQEENTTPSTSNVGSWPEYIPDEIPPFDADIDMIMADNRSVRIFYVNVSEAYLKDYLKTLEKKGFNLEYQYYKQEGFEDTTEKRIKKGDYDAIQVDKDHFSMNLKVGDGTLTYDIRPSSFPDDVVIDTTFTLPNMEGKLSGEVSTVPNIDIGAQDTDDRQLIIEDVLKTIPALSDFEITTTLMTTDTSCHLFVDKKTEDAVTLFSEGLIDMGYVIINEQIESQKVYSNKVYTINVNELMNSNSVVLKIELN